MPHSLHAFGLHLLADLPIPGAQPAPDWPSPDATVTLGLPSQAGPSDEAGPYTLKPDALVFRMPGVAEYRCALRGDCIDISARPGVPEALVAEYLIATALPALLWCRGATMLHAAAAVLPAQTAAVALAGPSGIGKSTLLRKLLEAGTGVVADDSLALRTAGSGRALASGLPAATRDANPGHFLPVPLTRQRASAPLGLMVELVPGGPELPERQAGAQAVAVLLRNLHRPRIPHLLGQDADVFTRLAALTTSLAVYRWDAEQARRTAPAGLLRVLTHFQSVPDR